MRRLSPRVNVIPVIGKADTLTPSELKTFKKRIMEDIEHYDIPIYNFPYDVEEDDEETIMDNSELRALLPFAIIGSEEEVEVDGELIRARVYPWGLAEVDNPKHSDFSRLRSALLNSHLTDLKSLTHDVLYETYHPNSDLSDSSILPEDLATQSVRLKEEQLRREEEKLREIELKVQREINEKRQELLAKEESLSSDHSLALDPSVICTACTDNGQNPPVDGQSASLTSSNNFLNFCAGKTLTNGQQITGGSCNGVVMGEIIPQNNMPAAKITFPTNGGTFPADQSFQFKMSIQNMITGNFVNAQTNYYGAPQFLQGNTVVGHSHVTVQLLPDIKSTEPLDPTTFAFFKGINTRDQGGVLTVDVTNGLPAGAYRFCTVRSRIKYKFLR
ncbi:12196_t:CDS:2 [Acaulospora colombiana]|uniref:12196_t:CDS:1 n=1 Tax=Acaulospora colombiana TaxID=27376 RepID=A0ACA9KV08_9GLOM|nr:12196_t:CDS:2 [Acaulospora colombiana]